MDENRLGNFRNDVSQLPDEADADPEIQASMYHQELNTLKIEKLSNRVTIISVIIPCLITAILAFAYLDMKERVVDVDETKGSQVEHLAKKLDEKLNALDVRIAQAKFQLDETLPEMEKKRQALENQMAKISADKADLKAFQSEVKKLEKKIKTNAGQDKTTLAAMERINQDLLAAIKENNTQFKSKSDQIKEEMQLFKEEFDARLLELSAYEQQIGQLGKSVSLLDKQVKTLKQDTERQMALRLDQMKLLMEERLRKLEGSSQVSSRPADSREAPGSPAPSTASPETGASKSALPEPQLDTGVSQPAGTVKDTQGSQGFSEKTLSQ